MNKTNLDNRLREYYASQDFIPAPDATAIDETVKAALADATRRHAFHARQLFSPNVVDLVISQLRTTKFLVWIIQALVVILALMYAFGLNDKAHIFGAFGAASALLAGLSIAGMTFDQNAPLVEMSYSFHFDYRQIVITRMMLYGFVDLIGLVAFTVFGSSLSPLGLCGVAPGFTEVLLCSATTFFATGFTCLLVISRYRGEGVLILCFIFSLVIVLATILLLKDCSSLLFAIPTLFWLLVVALVVLGLVLCMRSFFVQINAGYEFIRS